MAKEGKYQPRRYLPAADRKREILDVAIPMFFTQGFEGTEMGEVARAAGVSRGLINRHFGSKRGLLLAAVRAIATIEPEGIVADPEMPLARRIEINSDAWLDHVEANRDMIAIAHLRVSNDADVAAVIDEAREALVDRMLANYVGATEVPEVMRVMLRGFIALVLAACHDWLWEGRASREQVRILMVTTLGALLEDTAPALLRTAP